MRLAVEVELARVGALLAVDPLAVGAEQRRRDALPHAPRVVGDAGLDRVHGHGVADDLVGEVDAGDSRDVGEIRRAADADVVPHVEREELHVDIRAVQVTEEPDVSGG